MRFASASIDSKHGFHLVGREVADLEAHHDAARDDVRGARFGANAPDGGYLGARHRRRDPIHGERQLGCREEGIPPAIHRRGARMIRRPLDRDIPPANSDDALDDADVDGGLVEDRALLDVQLDESRDGARGAARLGEA